MSSIWTPGGERPIRRVPEAPAPTGPAEAAFDDGEELSPEDAMLEYAQCMREHGIDMPDPEFRGGGGSFPLPDNADSEEFEAAQEACKQYFGPPESAGVGGAP